MPDWVTIAAWAAGISTVAGSVIGTLWVTINRAMQIAKTTPPNPTVTKTDVFTTDTIAMRALGASVDANMMTLVQTNLLLTEIVTVGKDFTSMMREEREEREFEDEVQKRVEVRLKENRRRSKVSQGTTPSPRRRTVKPQTP